MSYAAIEARLAPQGLGILGGFHPTAADKAPKETQTVLMIGPVAGFWPIFIASPEYRDGKPDPMDRWSRRIIGALVCDVGGKAVFPFGGPPFQPFITWAQRTGRAWQSPVGLLVHDTAGLFVSYRGALALRERLDLPARPEQPCARCSQPCLSACPVDALGAQGYNVPTCKTYIAAQDDCLSAGCKVRRVCPVSQSFDRCAEQSAFHMKAFLG